MQCINCIMEGKGMVAGQAFTKYVCEVCGQEGFWHNTAVPKICPSCSEAYMLCERCGKNLLKEAIMKAKDKTNLYDVALDIGCSESSLYKYLNEGKIGKKVYNKIKNWYNNLK